MGRQHRLSQPAIGRASAQPERRGARQVPDLRRRRSVGAAEHPCHRAVPGDGDSLASSKSTFRRQRSRYDSRALFKPGGERQRRVASSSRDPKIALRASSHGMGVTEPVSTARRRWAISSAQAASTSSGSSAGPSRLSIGASRGSVRASSGRAKTPSRSLWADGLILLLDSGHLRGSDLHPNAQHPVLFRKEIATTGRVALDDAVHRHPAIRIASWRDPWRTGRSRCWSRLGHETPARTVRHCAI